MKLISLTEQEGMGMVEIEFEGKNIVVEFPLYVAMDDGRHYNTDTNPWVVQRNLSGQTQEQIKKENLLMSAKNAVARYFVVHLFNEMDSLNNLKQ